MSSFVEKDSSYLVLLAMATLSTVVSFCSCSIELSILLLLFSVSLLLELWFNETVLIFYQTLLWTTVTIWFYCDKRRESEFYSSTVVDEHDTENIELT
mgnify:FL=1